MDADFTPRPRRSIDLAAAAHLEMGLDALEHGNMPAAIGALASIDDDSWTAIGRRFPGLPDYIASEVTR